MDPLEQFESEKSRRIEALAGDAPLQAKAMDWMLGSCKHGYTYNFSWLGVPVIQFPQDLMALQEIVTSTRPEVIVETGVAHGGSLVFSASLLALLGGEGRVVGVDVDIRPHNRERLETHPLSKYITLIEGSSIDKSVLSQVREIVDERRVLVVLDSNHTHAHVLRELELYSPMVREGGYVVVFDTALEDAPKEMADDRPWGPGNSPRTAIAEFLEDNSRFQIDRALGGKLHITVSPDGYLKCIGDPP